MTPLEAARAVAVLQAAYPRSAMTDATAELYEAMLSDLDVELANAAIRRLVCTSTFLPSIAEIRAAAADVVAGPRRRGAEAWGDVVRAIRRFGSYRAPEFDDPLVMRAVDAMGWRNLCLGDANEASDRARFAEVYDALSSRARSDMVSAPRLVAASPRGQLRGGRIRELK